MISKESLRTTLAQAETERESLRTELTALRQMFGEVLSSGSWRITAPPQGNYAFVPQYHKQITGLQRFQWVTPGNLNC